MVANICDIQVAACINGNTGRGIEQGQICRSAIAAKAYCSVTRYRRDNTIRPYPADSGILIIADI